MIEVLLIIAACVIGACAVTSPLMWLYYRHARPHVITPALREQRKLARRLGRTEASRATVDTRLMPHQDVLALAGALGYVAVDWSARPSGRTTYNFQSRVTYPPPCWTVRHTPAGRRRQRVRSTP